MSAIMNEFVVAPELWQVSLHNHVKVLYQECCPTMFQVYFNFNFTFKCFTAQECTTTRELLATKIAGLTLPSAVGDVKAEIASMFKALSGEDSWRHVGFHAP